MTVPERRLKRGAQSPVPDWVRDGFYKAVQRPCLCYRYTSAQKLK